MQCAVPLFVGDKMAKKHGKLNEADLKAISEKIESLRNDKKELNKIIREQIFTILEQECTVLYFPIGDKKADACFLPRVDHIGNIINFVFIDTSKRLEDQVFACAHELAHILKVSDVYCETLTESENDNGLEFEVSREEAIAYRFAAELLIPKDIFVQQYTAKIKETANPNFLETIIFLMDMFLVSFKAISYRLDELGYLKSGATKFLTEFAEKYDKEIRIYQKKLGLCEQNNLVSERKSFGNFINILDNLYVENKISGDKYKYFLDLFGADSVVALDENSEEAINKGEKDILKLFQSCKNEKESGG